jgi:anti-sigma-K factor RskA
MDEHDKDRYRKITLACAIVVALAAVVTAALAYHDAPRPLVADVNCVHWKAPLSVVAELKAIEHSKSIPMDPNRMTAKAAQHVCSLYTIKTEMSQRTQKCQFRRLFIGKSLG